MKQSDAAAIEILELIRPLSAFTVGLTEIFDACFGTRDAGDAENQAVLALIRSPSMATTDLRRQSGLTRRAHHRFVEQLVEHGLVDQARSARDQRVHLLALTRRGRDRARELEQRLGDYFTDSRDLATDILAHLGQPDATSEEPPDGALSPLDLLDLMSSLGNNLDAAIRACNAPQHPKNRDQLALLLIASGELGRPSQLADALTLTAGGMTRVLNKLEADRLIVRNHGQVPGDRRAVVIELTSDGREVVAAIATGVSSMKSELRSIFATVAALAMTTTTNA